MADLESLNNKELRIKCLEFGLPDIPVTDATRNVLIRKLYAAINDTPLASSNKKQNKRRETIQIAPKPQSPKPTKATVESRQSKDTANNRTSTNRRTFAAPTFGSVPSSDEENYNVNAAEQRRQMPPPPQRAVPDAPKPATGFFDNSRRPQQNSFDITSHPLHNSTTVTDYASSSSDTASYSNGRPTLNWRKTTNDYLPSTPPMENRPNVAKVTECVDVTPPVLYNYVPVTNTPALNRLYPNLPASNITQPSINNYTAPVANRYNYSPISPPVDDRQRRSVSLTKSEVVTTSFSQEKSPQTIVLEDDYESDEPEPVTTARYGNFGYKQSPTKPKPIGTPYTSLLSSSQPNYLRTLNPTQTSLSRRTISNTIVPPVIHDHNDFKSKSRPSLRALHTSTYTELNGSNEELSEQEVSSDDDLEKPYYRDFTRNTYGKSTTGSGGAYARTSLAAPRIVQRSTLYSANPAPRRPLAPEDDSLMGIVRQFFLTLEEKYNLRQFFILILIFILTAFVYVFFIQPAV